MSEQPTAHEAMATVKNYLCSRCWGRLIAHDLDVTCVNPDCDGEGFVTFDYVQRRRAEDGADAAEARIHLRDILNLKKKDRTPEKILEDLGY